MISAEWVPFRLLRMTAIAENIKISDQTYHLVSPVFFAQPPVDDIGNIRMAVQAFILNNAAVLIQLVMRINSGTFFLIMALIAQRCSRGQMPGTQEGRVPGGISLFSQAVQTEIMAGRTGDSAVGQWELFWYFLLLFRAESNTHRMPVAIPGVAVTPAGQSKILKPQRRFLTIAGKVAVTFTAVPLIKMNICLCGDSGINKFQLTAVLRRAGRRPEKECAKMQTDKTGQPSAECTSNNMIASQAKS